MGLFNSTCCPPKPRRTIDYILNWIDKYGPIITKDTSYITDLLDWRRTVEHDLNGYVKNAADEYITNYDWSQVPEFDEKADKVENAVLGHLASLDANGNLVDSGSGIGESIEQGNMDLATCNALYVALQGKADSVHTHSGIENVVEDSQYAKVYVDNQIQGEPGVIIELNDSNTPGGSVTKSANINIDSIDNLNRALQNPVKATDVSPAHSDNKLITAAAVLDKLLGKLDIPYESLMVKFDVSGGALALVSDITEYDDIFALASPVITVWYTMFVGIYNSNDDVYTPFLGVASVRSQYSHIDGTTLEKILVTIYVGGYTIHLEKNVLTDAISVSMDSFAALLQNP